MTNNPSDTRIKKLSPLLINQLAAGEVVTRPAAVVKELLENAIDAGATYIEVHVTQGGMGMIEVVDNGVGIHPDDMIMAITRHATSKVADVANLHGIMTLGFRGEALAATAAVSRLTLISSHDHSGIGRQLQVAGVLDDIPRLSPVVHNRGTTITVRDLYFNVPARRGNLKSMAIEFGHIETVVREVALARADITITLFHDKKKRLSLSASTISTNNVDGDNNRLSVSRLEQAMGVSLTDNAIEVAVDLSGLVQPPIGYDVNQSERHAAITGWLWPMHEKNDALPKLIYVNGRLVKEAIISNQLRQIAQEAQLAGIGYALYFDLPTEWLNVNVHPSKQRIRISPLNNIMAHLSHTLRPKLVARKSRNSIQQDKRVSSDVSSNLDSINTGSAHADVINQPSDKDLPKTGSINHNDVTQGRQVQSPKASYQSSEKSEYPKHVDSFIREPLSPSSSTLNMPPTDAATVRSGFSGDIASLPHCLDVITGVSDMVSESIIGQYRYDKPLPWLLFYYQRQCLLIGAEDWRVQVGLLFESTVLNSHISKNRKIHANEINQQLATICAQMTQQDLALFITDIEALLMSNAIKVINRDQLIALMLTSI
ncbi:DNA mismatch repair endonuclease MutL [Psychrobacter alimentarius]|uniref:DNA mismatch repair endonuclease MutL n=1 Tax=Psychrobacter alimentarius TaxID=261164 RepID=UPI00191805AD|nr:DNA mismatch repair endonuclease MutL [Psychrobacter alimentarius]